MCRDCSRFVEINFESEVRDVFKVSSTSTDTSFIYVEMILNTIKLVPKHHMAHSILANSETSPFLGSSSSRNLQLASFNRAMCACVLCITDILDSECVCLVCVGLWG